MSDELPAPSDYDILVVTNTDTQVYDLPVVTTDISVNTNPVYATTRFGEAQQSDTFHTYVNMVAQQPDSSHTYANVVAQSNYM